MKSTLCSIAQIFVIGLSFFIGLQKSNAQLLDRSWLEKTSQILRNGKGLSSKDPIKQWETLSEDAFIDLMMNTTEFENSLTLFSMSYLGMRTDKIFSPSEEDEGLNQRVLHNPNVVFATQNFVKNKDYFNTLLSLRGPLYMRPLSKKMEDSYQKPGEKVEEARLRFIEKVKNWGPSFLAASKDTSIPFEKLCNDFLPTLFENAYSLGIANRLIDNIFGTDFWFTAYADQCRETPHDGFNREIEAIRYWSTTEALFSAIVQYEPNVYPVNKISDLRTIDYSFAGGPSDQSVFTTSFELSEDKPNSSTNFNRKRSAYILKTFFCDDLTPIGVALPETHTGNRHADEPSCYSCHYKLDPMAGFFRNYGRWFYNYTNSKNIVLSDGVIKDRVEYECNWLNRVPQNPQNLNIGYVRSTSDLTVNQYGEDLNDLEKILKSAPEVKSCFVKRLFQFSVGVNQSVSPGYLEYLTQNFTINLSQQTSNDPNAAFKSLWKSILKSKSFKEKNRSTNKCYDYSPLENSEKSLPCEVSSIVENRCLKCHSDTSAKGGLSMQKLILLADGKKAFQHLDSKGVQLSKSESFSRILNRLGESDPDLRMPLRMEIPNQERQILFLWSQRESQ